MRAALAVLLLAASAHAQVTVVKPNAAAVTIPGLYYACWSLGGVRQSCVAAGPSYADYARLAAFLQTTQNGVPSREFACFPVIK